MSSVFSRLNNTWSIEGLCLLSPTQDKASFSTMSNASTEYSPLSLGSANSEISPPLTTSLAWKANTWEELRSVLDGDHGPSLCLWRIIKT